MGSSTTTSSFAYAGTHPSIIKPIKINEGVIEFLTPDESGKIVNHRIEFEDQDVEKMKLLIKIIWQKIINLDIIDTSKYDNSLKGMIQLEDDLIAGKI